MIAPAMSITLPVTGVPDGEPAWDEVEWRRYMLDGQVWVVATVFAWDHEQGQVRGNRSWAVRNPVVDGEGPPAWVTRPSAEWDALAAVVVPAEAVSS